MNNVTEALKGGATYTLSTWTTPKVEQLRGKGEGGGESVRHTLALTVRTHQQRVTYRGEMRGEAKGEHLLLGEANFSQKF